MKYLSVQFILDRVFLNRGKKKPLSNKIAFARSLSQNLLKIFQKKAEAKP